LGVRAAPPAKGRGGHFELSIRKRLVVRIDCCARVVSPVAAWSDRQCTRRVGAPAAARRDSAPRGGEAGPHAAPGLRRARAGEDAGEGAAGNVDVVAVAPPAAPLTRQT